MSWIILAKHALPDMQADVVPSRWHLGEAGREGSMKLGEHLSHIEYRVERVVASTEPKAIETATIVARTLGLEPPTTYDGLREHKRDATGFLSVDQFQASARALFSQPDELVWGEETAVQALDRFAATVDGLGDGVLAVAHGTVISLYIERLCGIDGFDFWSNLGLPAYAVVDRKTKSLLSVVNSL